MRAWVKIFGVLAYGAFAAIVITGVTPAMAETQQDSSEEITTQIDIPSVVRAGLQPEAILFQETLPPNEIFSISHLTLSLATNSSNLMLRFHRQSNGAPIPQREIAFIVLPEGSTPNISQPSFGNGETLELTNWSGNTNLKIFGRFRATQGDPNILPPSGSLTPGVYPEQWILYIDNNSGANLAVFNFNVLVSWLP